MLRTLISTCVASALCLGSIGCSTPQSQSRSGPQSMSASAVATPALTRELAPSGTLRAAINVGNPILAARGPAGGDPTGVSVDLSREIAKRLGVPVRFVVFDAAGKVTDAAKSDAWDIAFLAVDPVRGADFLQSPPYVVIEGAYLVRAPSPITANDQVDRDGIRVAVGRGSAYDLFLTRELKHAALVRVPTSPAVVDTFLAQDLEVAAGVRQQLEADAKRLPGMRLLDGRFMVINQAIGTQKGRDAGLAYLRSFVEEMKASGFVAESLKRNRVEGAAVAPPAN